jgi:prepilin-type N-terminal cleavage/methylation domain-containing protein
MQKHWPVRHGFTLIELLIVIGLLALLLSILLPVVHSVREQGNMLQCLSNMRQLGTACRSYSMANHDKLIPLDYRDFSQATNANG